MSDALHSHPDRRDPACMTSLNDVAERGIPFSHTCSRLQCFAKRDYLKIAGEIHCRWSSIWSAPRMCPNVVPG